MKATDIRIVHCSRRLRVLTVLSLCVAIVGTNQAPGPATAQVPGNTNQPRTDRYGDPLPEGALARIGTPRFWHKAAVSNVLFADDGKTILTGALFDFASTSIPCWDSDTGKLKRQIHYPDSGFCCLAISPDGKTLACRVYGRDGILLIDFATGNLRQRLSDSMGGAFSPDGKTFASVGGGGIHFWDVASGKQRRHFEHWGHCQELAFAPDGETIALGSVYTVCLREVASGKKRWQFDLDRKLDSRVAFAFSPDGLVVAMGDDQGNVRLVKTDTGKEFSRLSGHNGRVTAIAFAPDGEHLASAADDNTVRIWNPVTGSQVHQIKLGGGADAWSLAFSPDSTTLASGDTFQTLRLWKVADGREKTPFVGHRSYVTAIAYAPNGSSIASTDYGGNIFHWDLLKGEPLGKFPGNAEPIDCLAFTPDSKAFVSGCRCGKMVLRDATNGKKLCSYEGHTDGVYSVVVSPDGKLIASASIDSSVRLWDRATGQEMSRMEGGTGSRWAGSLLAFAPDGKLLASGGEDGSIHIFDVVKGKGIQRFRGTNKFIPQLNDSSIAISSNGQQLAAAFDDGFVRIWQLTNGKQLHLLEHGSPSRLTSVAFAPDGRTIVAGYESSTVRLWEVASGQLIREFKGHSEMVYTVAFAPDGRSVASGSRDSTILVWDVTGCLAPTDEPSDVVRTDELDDLWAALALSDAGKAHAVLWRMVRSPATSVAFLRDQMRAVEYVGQERLARLIADLDVNDYAVRQRAHNELDHQGELAMPALRWALANHPTLELKARAEQLLGKLNASQPPGQRLRSMRALAVLEQIGTPPARDVLDRLSKGAQGAWLTIQAQEALKRLAANKTAVR